MPGDDPRLDNPAWHALTGPHGPVAEVAGAARRYPPEVSFFAAIERPDTAAWAGLAGLAGPGGQVVLARAEQPDPPAGWQLLGAVRGHQMVLPGDLAAAGDGPGAAAVFRPLTIADVPAMLELTGVTRPGPFFPETVRLGGYVGMEDGGRLVAMAGRRLHLPGRVEISAVCVHPDVAGRGLGFAVTRRVARDIIEGGEAPFLHVAEGNAGARRVYERLGFTVRTTVEFRAFAAPEP